MENKAQKPPIIKVLQWIYLVFGLPGPLVIILAVWWGGIPFLPTGQVILASSLVSIPFLVIFYGLLVYTKTSLLYAFWANLIIIVGQIVNLGSVLTQEPRRNVAISFGELLLLVLFGVTIVVQWLIFKELKKHSVFKP